MSSPRTKRLSQTARRDQLLEAARGEFLTRGYGEGRLQAIAEACGVTEALVYKHFDSKRELYEAAVMAPLDELLRRRIDDILALPVDPRADAQLETTRQFMRTLLHTFSESVQTIGVVLFGEREHAMQFYARHIRALIDAAVAASESTIDTWSHREYDIRTAMKAAFGMAFWLALDGVLDEPTADLDATADQLAEILFEGLKAR